MQGKRKRKVAWAVAILLGLPCILWLSLPLWFPLFLKPVAGRFGANFNSYERRGYQRFQLHGMTYTNGVVQFHADKVEALVPNVWLWRILVSKSSSPGRFAMVENWRLDITKSSGTNANRSATNSVAAIAEAVSKIVDRVNKWAPVAWSSNGAVHFPGGGLEVPFAVWTPNGLKGQFKWITGGQDVVLEAKFGKSRVTKMQLHSDALMLQSTMNVTLNSAGLNLQSRNLWRGNRVDLQAQFGHSGVLPEKAALQAPAIQIAADQFGINAYQQIYGAAFAKWERDHFDLTVNASAEPSRGATNAPPLKIDLRARGDTNGASIKTATIASSFLSAELSENFNVYFSKPYIRSPGFFNISANLSEQAILPLIGTLDGTAQFTATSNTWPVAEFHFTGLNVGQPGFVAEEVIVGGELRWPSLEINRAGAVFEDGSLAEAKSVVDLQKRDVISGTLQLSGSLANRWLPKDFRIESALLNGSFHGPFTNLNHEGHLHLGNFSGPGLQTLQGDAVWEGNSGSINKSALTVSATNSSLQASAALQWKPHIISLTVNSLALENSRIPLLKLAKPLDFKFQTAGSNWNLQSSELLLSGKAGQIKANASIDWPQNGSFDTALSDMDSESLRDFLPLEGRKFQLRSCVAHGAWTNGPLNGVAALQGSATLGDDSFSVNLNMGSGPAGIVLSNLTITRQTSIVATASGQLPLSIKPGAGSNSLQIDHGAPLELRLHTEPKSALWDRLSEVSGVQLNNPNFEAAISGTWQKPEGDLHLSADAFKFGKVREELPKFEKLRLSVHFDKGIARIAEGQLLVQGQPITLSGELPFGDEFWNGLKDRKLPDFDKANALLKVDRAQISAFASLIPAVLSPEGLFTLNLAIQPGGHLQGQAVVEKARTRPVGNLGPVRDIMVDMRINDRRIVLESAAANIGGSTVTATGSADLRGTNWFATRVPPFQILVQGTNVPLERQPESIIRSDLELSITKTNENPAVISGTAKLRNSFYLRDISELVPGGVSAPARRPPYFSIEQLPLANWRLGVHVTGERALKVRSTVFNGEISANVQLEGTLKDPLAIGDVRIDSGLIRFPFATLDVKQGFVTLTSGDPFHPRLQVSAGSKKFGYELRMEATGPADAPVLQFTSTPPLSSEQIVLMVTAGELPKGSYTLSPQQKAQTVAVFVGRDLLTKFGLADDSEDRLTFQSGQEISEQGRPTYGMEYKLNRRWSLVGEYDRFNAFNAGVKWRVYSK